MTITRMRGIGTPSHSPSCKNLRVSGSPKITFSSEITRATPRAIPHIPKVETKGLRPT